MLRKGGYPSYKESACVTGRRTCFFGLSGCRSELERLFTSPGFYFPMSEGGRVITGFLSGKLRSLYMAEAAFS